MGKRLLQNPEEEMQYFIPSSSFIRDVDHSRLAQSFASLYLKIDAQKKKTSFVYTDPQVQKDPFVQQELKGSLVFMNNYIE
jgi:hypothetical protein